MKLFLLFILISVFSQPGFSQGLFNIPPDQIEFGLGDASGLAPKERYPGEFTTEDYQIRKKYEIKPRSQRRYQKVNMLTIDTRDSATCQKMARRLKDTLKITAEEYAHLCDEDPENPLVTIAVVGNYTTRSVNYSDMSPRQQKLTRQTRNFIVPATGMMVLLFALPSSLTGWEEFNASELGEKYISNVKEGPVMDTDEWWINWIGHPYSGAAYYVVARHAGFNRTESFLYSAFMSTFFWEYGIEAFAEVPSIQDLILTPALGALLGEAFMQGEQMIYANDGKVLGSERLGNIALVIMDPAGAILDSVDRLFVGHKIKDTRISYGLGRSKDDNYEFSTDNMIFRLGIDLYF